MQLALTLVKYRVDADEQIRERKNYFIATMIVCGIFYIILLPTAGLFLHRYFHAWRTGRAWSRRRAIISTYSCILLFCQIANLTFMMIGVSYAIAARCNWQSNVMISMGYSQWTTWNCTLIVLVALAHNGSVWKGETKLEKKKSWGRGFLTTLNKSGADRAAAGNGSDAAEKGIKGAGDNTSTAAAPSTEPTPGSPSSSYGTAASTEDKVDGTIKDISPGENPSGAVGVDKDSKGANDKAYGSPKGFIKRSDTLAEESDEEDPRSSFYRVNSHEPTESSPPPALVIDAPWTVHLKKVIIWLVMQAMLTQMLVRMLVKGLPGACRGDGPLTCGPTTIESKISIGFIIAAIILYFLTYLRFSWQADKDIRSRAYAEMRFARIVFGVGHEQVMPVFLAFIVCTVVLMTVKTDSCWTFVQTW